MESSSVTVLPTLVASPQYAVVPKVKDMTEILSGQDLINAGIPQGKKSVGVAVTLQPREKTLTDVEIEQIAGKIVAEVTKKTGASLRG